VTKCNGFDQRVVRQRHCKHGSARISRGSCVSVDLTDAPEDWLDTDHVICVYYWSMFVPRLHNESREL
jgi:hypothetical protein